MGVPGRPSGWRGCPGRRSTRGHLAHDRREGVRPPEAIPFALGQAYTVTVRKPDGSAGVANAHGSGLQRKATAHRRPRPGRHRVQGARRHGTDQGQHVPGRARDGRRPGHHARRCRAPVFEIDSRSPREHGWGHRLPPNDESLCAPIRRGAGYSVTRAAGAAGLRQEPTAGVRPYPVLEVRA